MLLLFGERSADKHGDGTPEVAACRPVTSRSDADRQSFVVAVTLATYTLTSATYVLAAESGRLVGHELGAVGVRSARRAYTTPTRLNLQSAKAIIVPHRITWS